MRDQWQSVDAALAWAYRVAASDILKLSSLGRMRGAERRSSDATPHEIHAQAAVIMAHVGRLPDLDQAYIHARYWPSRRDRSGEMDDTYREALSMLVRSVLATQSTGMHNQRAAQVAILQYFEGATSRNGQSIRWVREELHCRKGTALEYRRAVHDRLDAIQRDAWNRLDLSLGVAGLLPAHETAAAHPSP